MSSFLVENAGAWEIEPSEIVLGRRIGKGSYGEVHRCTWLRTEVAVKRFLEQDLLSQQLQEFRCAVSLSAHMLLHEAQCFGQGARLMALLWVGS